MYILYACLAALCELWVVLYNMLLLLNVIWNLSMRNVDQVHTHTHCGIDCVFHDFAIHTFRYIQN